MIFIHHPLKYPGKIAIIGSIKDVQVTACSWYHLWLTWMGSKMVCLLDIMGSYQHSNQRIFQIRIKHYTKISQTLSSTASFSFTNFSATLTRLLIFFSEALSISLI